MVLIGAGWTIFHDLGLADARRGVHVEQEPVAVRRLRRISCCIDILARAVPPLP